MQTFKNSKEFFEFLHKEEAKYISFTDVLHINNYKYPFYYGGIRKDFLSLARNIPVFEQQVLVRKTVRIILIFAAIALLVLNPLNGWMQLLTVSFCFFLLWPFFTDKYAELEAYYHRYAFAQIILSKTNARILHTKDTLQKYQEERQLILNCTDPKNSYLKNEEVVKYLDEEQVSIFWTEIYLPKILAICDENIKKTERIIARFTQKKQLLETIC